MAARIAAEARGSVEAQHVIASIASGDAEPALAWLRFAELACEAGWRTPACRAFPVEIAKRAGAAQVAR